MIKPARKQAKPLDPRLIGLMRPIGSVATEPARKALSVLPSTPLDFNVNPYNPDLSVCDTTSPFSDGGVMLNGEAVPYGTRVRVRWRKNTVLRGVVIQASDTTYIADRPIPPLPKNKVRVFFDDGSWDDAPVKRVELVRTIRRRVNLD